MRRRLVPSLATVLALAAGSASAVAQSAPATLQSARRARAVLSSALDAVGGLRTLDTLRIIREYVGTTTDPAQNVHAPAPGAALEVTGHPRITRVRDYRTGDAVDVVANVIPGDQPLTLRAVARGDTGFLYMHDAGTLRRAPPPPLPVWRASLQNAEIDGLLLAAWRDQSSARWLGSARVAGRPALVVAFTDRVQTTTTIYVDSVTHLPLKAETLSDDPIRGDVLHETLYSDWRRVDGIRTPSRIDTRLNGRPLQHLDLVSVRTGVAPDSLFSIPDDAVSTHPPPDAPIALGADAFVVPNRYQSAFVAFDDYVIVFEPGGSSREARATIAAAHTFAPGKPIRYVIATHAHFDHLAGAREYMAIGTTFVTTPAAKQVIERAARARHDLQPDALSFNPRDVLVETVSDSLRTFRDAHHELRVYNLGATPHVDAMLFVYLPATRTLLEADALDIPEPGHVRVGGDDTQHLAERLQQLGLDVDRIVPVHGRVGTLSDLRAALAKRSVRREP